MVGLPHCSALTLSALLDGELTPVERAAARAHLDSCLDCGARLLAARRLDADLRDAGRLSCASVLPLLSAIADDEAGPAERPLAAAHLADCPDCRRRSGALTGADRLLAALPPAAPAPRVDAYIAALAHPRPRALFRPVPFAFRTAGALALAVLIALGATLVPAGGPSAEQVARSTEVAMVAAIQRVVFDARTNTLYLLDTERAEVSAIDATTQAERARVSVGGKPTALALSIATDRVLVLDATSKRLTEIDASTQTIVSSATLVITGTPTSLQVDPANGKIVVASVSAALDAPAASAAGATGHVTVLDAVSKQVETVRAVDVAPQLVVLDAKGAQALLLSATGTTLVDATSYRSLDQLPGGVAAAFDASGTQIAVLSANGDGSRVTFRGAGLPATLALPGRPITLIGMPGGGFAALVDRGTGGEVEVIDATGHLSSSTAVVLAGHSVTYDPVAGRFAVGGDGGTSLAFSGPAPVAASAPVAGTPPPPSQNASAAPSPSPSPAAPSPSAPAPVSTGPLAATPAGLPPAARLTGDGTYTLPLPENRRPILVAGAGARLWFVDTAKRLATIDTTSGAVSDVAQLPLDGTFTRLLLGTGHAYAIDQGKGRLAILTLGSGRIETVGFPFVTTAAGFAVGPDDRLWMAGGESSNVLALDPATKGVAAINFRTSGITALFVDSAARVWYADDASGGIGHYDQATQVLATVPSPRHASVTALAMDRNGTLWAGTAAGTLLSVHAGPAVPAGGAGGPVSALVRDAAGGVWSYALAPGATAYRALTAGSGAQLAAVSASGIGFDGPGRVWLADQAGAAFHIALNGAE